MKSIFKVGLFGFKLSNFHFLLLSGLEEVSNSGTMKKFTVSTKFPSTNK